MAAVTICSDFGAQKKKKKIEQVRGLQRLFITQMSSYNIPQVLTSNASMSSNHYHPEKVRVVQPCPTLHDPIDYSPPGSSVCGILSTRILEWVAILFSRSSQPKDRTQISCIAGRFFTIQGTREARFIQNRATDLQSVPLFSSVQFSRSVVSDSLRPHESQHTRPPCPSPNPGVYLNSCPSNC